MAILSASHPLDEKLQNASSDLVSDLELSRTGLMERTIDQQQARTS